MKIKQYVFEWLDKRNNKQYREVKFGKLGESWANDFSSNEETLELKNTVVTEIELETGVEFLFGFNTDWVLKIDYIYSDEDIKITELEIGGTGIFEETLSLDELEELLNKFECEHLEAA